MEARQSCVLILDLKLSGVLMSTRYAQQGRQEPGNQEVEERAGQTITLVDHRQPLEDETEVAITRPLTPDSP